MTSITKEAMARFQLLKEKRKTLQRVTSEQQRLEEQLPTLHEAVKATQQALTDVKLRAIMDGKVEEEERALVASAQESHDKAVGAYEAARERVEFLRAAGHELAPAVMRLLEETRNLEAMVIREEMKAREERTIACLREAARDIAVRLSVEGSSGVAPVMVDMRRLLGSDSSVIEEAMRFKAELLEKAGVR